MALQNDVALALSLLTRLPIRLADSAFARSAQAAWAYPLVGLVTGAVSAVVGLGALAIGLPAVVAAILALGAGIIITGAMHEDGLADCADGFWGGWDPEMRLKIMKDSQIGTYGVIALALSLALRVAALTVILPAAHALWTIVAIHVASRAVMPAVMVWLPLARDNGLSARVGAVPVQSAFWAAGIGALALIIGFQQGGVGLALAAMAACTCAGQIAKAKIGGQTGDVIGAHQQVAELVLLMGALTLV